MQSASSLASGRPLASAARTTSIQATSLATSIRTSRIAFLGPRHKGVTQFGRALAEFNVDIICANTAQAKGRVERMNLTFQDRLVKELRLAGVSSMEEGNAFAHVHGGFQPS